MLVSQARFTLHKYVKEFGCSGSTFEASLLLQMQLLLYYGWPKSPPCLPNKAAPIDGCNHFFKEKISTAELRKEIIYVMNRAEQQVTHLANTPPTRGQCGVKGFQVWDLGLGHTTQHSETALTMGSMWAFGGSVSQVARQCSEDVLAPSADYQNNQSDSFPYLVHTYTAIKNPSLLSPSQSPNLLSKLIWSNSRLLLQMIGCLFVCFYLVHKDSFLSNAEYKKK